VLGANCAGRGQVEFHRRDTQISGLTDGDVASFLLAADDGQPVAQELVLRLGLVPAWCWDSLLPHTMQ
jgi:hypothetical protein